MHDFPPNSRKAMATDQPREKLQPVTSAEAVRRKRGLGRQFKETFFSGSAKDALGYMVEAVIVPAVRDTFADAMQSGIDRLIYGEGQKSRPTRTPWMGGPAPRVDYQGMSRAPKSHPSHHRTLSRGSRARHSFDELLIPSLQEANEVLDRMYDVLSRYGVVSVADLYELTGIQSSHTDMKWGWSNLQGARAIGNRRTGGYILDLPDPESIG